MNGATSEANHFLYPYGLSQAKTFSQASSTHNTSMYNTIVDYTALLESTCGEIYIYIDVMMVEDSARTLAGR